MNIYDGISWELITQKCFIIDTWHGPKYASDKRILYFSSYLIKQIYKNKKYVG